MRSASLGLAALFSGIAALVWQVLWIRRLSEAFGHTAYAVNAVLAIFFTGLGLGAFLFGRVADRRQGSIALYCTLEIAIAAAGLAFGAASDGVERFYLSFAPAEWPLSSSLLFKGAASALLLAIPTLAMGGTLPALLRHAVRTSRDLGPRVAWLYGLNTVGAGLGAAIAVLSWIPDLGVEGATLGAAGLNVVAAGLAWLGRFPRSAESRPPALADSPLRRKSPVVLLAAAALSGWVTVGLEVLWTRALATRFLNTVYSFATILTVFLFSLGVASVATARLDRRGWVTRSTLAAVLATGGILGLVSVLLLSRIPTSWGTGTGSSVAGFLFREVRYSVALMALPVLVLGLAFPMIVRLAHAELGAVGRETGEVYLANTAGSVAAPLVLGFAALPTIGLKASLVLLSWISVLFAVFCLLPRAVPLPRRLGRGSLDKLPKAATAGGILALAAAIQLLLPADIRLWRGSPGDRLVDYREGVTCAVAVLDEEGGDRVLKLNNDYVLGGLKGAHLPRRQGLLPLLFHSPPEAPPEAPPGARPENSLFIGLGTGGSAGAAAAWPELRVDALEIVPEVVDMLPWFEESNEHLAERTRAGERVRILPVDGRHFVRATEQRYDVVVGDLFLPYRAGEGAMYTREHVEAVRQVLAPGGLFCQWLPLYQFRRADLRVVVATFCDVFPQVEAFWLYPHAAQPVIGLVGTNEPLEIDPAALEVRLGEAALADLLASADISRPEWLLSSWIADRTVLVEWSAGAPVETQDRPRIEFSAPRNTIGSPEDPSQPNLLEFLALTRSATEAGPFARFPVPERVRIAACQRALAHFLRAPEPHADGSSALAALDELARGLADAPDWTPLLVRIKALARTSIERGDLGAGRRAAEILLGTQGQEHAGLYFSALLALRTGDAEAAERLARAALQLKPDHRATLELLEEIRAHKDRIGTER